MASEWKTDRHEEPSVRNGRVLALVFGFLALTAILFGGLTVYYRSILQDHLVTVTLRDFPAPQLQPNPTQDYVNFRHAQVDQLDRTGPAGGGASGLMALPIEQAMAVVVARGAKAYDPVAGTPPSGPLLATGAGMDGAPRATREPDVAPYGMPK